MKLWTNSRRPTAWITASVSAATSCGLTLLAVFAHADEPRHTIRLPSTMAVDAAAFDSGPPDAGVDASAEFRITRTPPDPPPMKSKDQWIFDLRYDHGDIYLVETRTLSLPAPQETPRAMGRFAVELFEGPTLIERVRFDFPFLGAQDVRDAGTLALDKRVVSRIGVIFPATGRGTRLELRDRATDERWALPWPPAPPASSAGQMNNGPDATVPR